MNKQSLVDKFLKELNGQELRAIIYSSSALVHQSGWHTEKYFKKYYKSVLSYPIILLMKGDEGILSLPVTKEKEMVKEMFKLFWKSPEEFWDRDKKFKEVSKELDKVYFKMNYNEIKKESEKQLCKNIEMMNEEFWDMNALVFYAIYFDKQVCEELIKELNINISQERLNEIWIKATTPVGISFAKRRELYLLDLILKGEKWEKIAENCQYFDTAYDHVSSVDIVLDKLKREYGNISKSNAKSKILEAKKEVADKNKENEKWINTLSKDEQRLVRFAQYIINLRDERKDFILKMVTALFRCAERFFEELNIPKDLIIYCNAFDLSKGKKNIEKIAEKLKKMKKEGMVLFVHYNGTQEMGIGNYDNEKKRLMEVYSNQNLSQQKGEIKGQIGCSGIIKGRVVLIKSFKEDYKKMQKGENCGRVRRPGFYQ